MNYKLKTLLLRPETASIMILKYPFTILVTIAIWVLSLFPLSLPEPITDVPFYDKWGHFVMYGTFTLIVLWESRRAEHVSWNKTFLWKILAIVLMSGLLELLQAYATTNRSGEWADFLANSTGVLIGTAIYLATNKLLKQRI